MVLKLISASFLLGEKCEPLFHDWIQLLRTCTDLLFHVKFAHFVMFSTFTPLLPYKFLFLSIFTFYFPFSTSSLCQIFQQESHDALFHLSHGLSSQLDGRE